jgi:CheY-like chemotaxis protein
MLRTAMGVASNEFTGLALVVDDEAVIRHYVRMVLRQLKFETVEAADGLEALEILRERAGAVDMVVTDIEMQNMSGLELARALRAEFTGLPLIIMSGNCETASLDQPVEFIRKPFLPQALLDSVVKVVAQAAGSNAGMKRRVSQVSHSESGE